ncbi:MAG: hypothetical protein V1750_01830 [Acidobacteriota bacterium]
MQQQQVRVERPQLRPHVGFHDLRHAAATPLLTVSTILGHSRLSTTSGICAHAMAEEAVNAAAKL